MEQVSIRESIAHLNDEWLFYLSPRFLSYRPKIKINVKTEKYTLKTADSMPELVELFRLRHSIFLEENQAENMLDVDQFDSECDHIVIKCNATNEICGTYRVITANNHVGFYSETEFKLDEFLSGNEVKMELGRACIHPYHRNGIVIDLLWKGIGSYAMAINADILFGCSSMPVVSNTKCCTLMNYLKKNDYYSEEYKIQTQPKFHYEIQENTCDLFSENEIKKMLPPLLVSYINAGAKVFGKPAFDQEFNCLDFLTILKLKDLKSSFKKRYFKDGTES